MAEETNGHETTIPEVGEALEELLNEGPALHLDAAQSFTEEDEDMAELFGQLITLWEGIFTASAVLGIELNGLDAKTAGIIEQLGSLVDADRFEESAALCGGVLLDCLEQWTEICFPESDSTDIPL